MGHVHAVFVGDHLSHAECSTARDHGDFVYWAGTFETPCSQCMACFVVSRFFFFVLGQNLFTLGSHQNLVVRVVEVLHLDFGFVFSSGPKCSFVDQVLDVCTGHPNSGLSHDVQIDIGP